VSAASALGNGDQRDGQPDGPRDAYEALLRENRTLRAQLERSERNRARLEATKDQDQMLLLRIIAELREAQTEVERSNAILEDRVASRTRQLSRSNEELTQARDAALAATRAKSSFLAVMSHELRTPLNAILGYTEILLDDVQEAELDREAVTRDLKKVRSSGHHLLNIIDDLLDVSRVEAGAVALRLEPVLLRPLLREVEQMIRPLARKQDNVLVVELTEAPTEVITDRTRIRQILVNLLGNAAKFTRGGKIVLRATEEAGALHFTVSDTGQGIPAEALERIFQPFTQFDGSATRRVGGPGLGLTLTRAFCNLLGGDIEVTSAVDVGSTFTVTLPRCPPRAPVLLEPTSEVARVQTGHGRLAVVVDDDPEGRASVEALLRDMGFTPVGFAEPEPAAEYLRAHRVALVLVDVLRADERGFGALRELAALCPTLALSSVDAEQRCRELGARGFLLRPTTPEAVRLQIARFVLAP
jgi:signal transduction histidine kinase/CheY-like chemotaxis protein